MTQTEEKKLVRALEKIAENTGKIAKEQERIADALEPDVLLVSTESQGEALPEIGEVTTEEALAAIKTIAVYCRTARDCSRDCGITRWCDYYRKSVPDDWYIEDDDND